MKHAYLFLAILALTVATSAAYSGVISEDVAYWCSDGSTVFDPTAEQLNALISTGSVLVKVQQTVYDQDWTHALLVRNGDGDSIRGYLYAYSVTNINLGNPADLTDMGIVDFAVNWSAPAVYVTTSQQTPSGWKVLSTTVPQWDWTTAGAAGILPGESVGGFWAVSSTGVDGVVGAQATRSVSDGREIVSGRTTGPVPEPISLMSLLSGLGGLGIVSGLRRR